MDTKNWQLLNQVINGDCLEVMKQIEDQSVDMILCDLPYGTTACKWDTVIDFESLWAAYKRIIKTNGAIVLTASQPFTSALVMSEPGWFKYSWVWKKSNVTGFVNANKRPLSQHEDITVFSSGAATTSSRNCMPYYPQGLEVHQKLNRRGSRGQALGERYNGLSEYTQQFTNYPRTILEFPYDREKFHPTQKPVALFEYLIKTYSNPGETILDNCLGSGTTAVAAINTDRNFIGIELDPGYCEIARQRIETAKQSKLNLE